MKISICNSKNVEINLNLNCNPIYCVMFTRSVFPGKATKHICMCFMASPGTFYTKEHSHLYAILMPLHISCLTNVILIALPYNATFSVKTLPYECFFLYEHDLLLSAHKMYL